MEKKDDMNGGILFVLFERFLYVYFIKWKIGDYWGLGNCIELGRSCGRVRIWVYICLIFISWLEVVDDMVET